MYTALEVAELLRLEGSEKSRRNAVYQIPSHDLPRTRIGPSGGRLRYLGRHVLDFIERRTVA